MPRYNICVIIGYDSLMRNKECTPMLAHVLPINNDHESRSDVELVRLANSSDDEAMFALMYRYRALVRSISSNYYLPGADRDDLMQEAFIGLFKAIRDFDPMRNERFDLFASMCVRRQIITALKTATRQKHLALNYALSLHKPLQPDENSGSIIDLLEDAQAQDPESLLANRETLEELSIAISATMSPLEYNMFLLYINGSTYKEIANKLKVNERAVTNGMYRVQKKLKKIKLQMELD
jgi:RNA polymerase sporulation-specific sigma factor